MGNQRLHSPQDLEGVERLHEVGVGSSFVGQERVDLSVEEEGDRPRLDIAHLLSLPHGETCGDAAHVADLEVEQHKARIDLHDGWHNVDARPHTVQEMGAGDCSLDLVGEGVGIGGEKDVRHATDGTRRPPPAHVPGYAEGRVSRSS